MVTAKDQMRFQALMSNTAHQREVADLQAAGLNPVLSAGGSGASTPTGAMDNVSSSGSSGSSGKRVKQNAKDGNSTAEIVSSTGKAVERVANSILKAEEKHNSSVAPITPGKEWSASEAEDAKNMALAAASVVPGLRPATNAAYTALEFYAKRHPYTTLNQRANMGGYEYMNSSERKQVKSYRKDKNALALQRLLGWALPVNGKVLTASFPRSS